MNKISLLSLRSEVYTCIDPERNHSTHGLEELVEPNQETANRAWCVLADIGWGDHGGTPKAKTFNETANVEADEAAEGKALEKAADESEHANNCESRFATKFVR